MNRSIFWTCDVEKLKELVSRSTTFTQIINHFGFVVAGPQIKSLKRRLNSAGIDYSHIPTGRSASKGRCNYKYEPTPADKVLIENSPHSRKVARRCVLQGKLLEYKCAICGMGPEWNQKPLTLSLDHKNGIRDDHRIENLQFVCPNCDTQSETYGSKNFRKKYNCGKCGGQINRRSRTGLCISCHQQASNIKPPKEILAKLTWQYPATEIAKQYGVSNQTILKWCRKYGLKHPGVGYWRKIEVQSP